MRESPRGGRLQPMWTGLKIAICKPKPEIVLLLICATAFALRLGPLFDNRFHPDEALFSTWALKIARGENLLLTGVPIDKPPLLIYLSALSFFVFGQSELAARMPNLIASVLSVVLVWRLEVGKLGTGRLGTSRLGNGKLVGGRPDDQSTFCQFTAYQSTSLLPPLLLALSPFAILFAPTAFLDPMMVMFGLASLVAASRGRAGWAGILLGLSFATKVQGLFFAPLIPIFWQQSRSTASPCHLGISSAGRPLWRFLLGSLSIALAIIAWDRMRGGLPFWVQQSINYGDIRVIYASELGPRLAGWLDFLPYFFGPIVGLLGLIGLPFLLYRDLTREARTRAARIDLWLLAYAVGFFVLHWQMNFPIWDRYLLILVPILALLTARVIHHLVALSQGDASQSPRHLVSPSFLLAIVTLAMLPFSMAAAESQYPIGGDHGANDGIDRVAVYLKSLPSGTVVYEHGQAWELGYYLGDGFAYLAYFDTPAAIADDLRVFASHGDRYVIFPARESPARVIDAVGQVGYTLAPVFVTQDRFGQTSFTIYRIINRKP
jgi:4-amino-4-deoxy-L-arabinose transferase-like glycosyltransferase